MSKNYNTPPIQNYESVTRRPLENIQVEFDISSPSFNVETNSRLKYNNDQNEIKSQKTKNVKIYEEEVEMKSQKSAGPKSKNEKCPRFLHACHRGRRLTTC